MKIFKPFERISPQTNLFVSGSLFAMLIGVWIVLGSVGTTHLFPTPSQVLTAFGDLYKEGLIVHIFSSLWLCAKAVIISVLISLVVCYLSPLPALKPIATFISKFRYLPLTGISFYIALVFTGARTIQVWVLVMFMTTYLITSILAAIKDIPEEEFDHARTLGCNRWEILWEVVIKGRFDYVIESIRQNLAIVWVMLVTVESILAAAGGIGFLIKNNDKNADAPKVVALQIIIIIIGVGLDLFFRGIRKVSFRFSKF